MKIKEYLKCKTILSKEKIEANIINGLVFRKNISNKKMKNEHNDPSILIVLNNLDLNSSESLMKFDELLKNENK